MIVSAYMVTNRLYLLCNDINNVFAIIVYLQVNRHEYF